MEICVPRPHPRALAPGCSGFVCASSLSPGRHGGRDRGWETLGICLGPHSKEAAARRPGSRYFASKPQLLPIRGVLLLKERVLPGYALGTPPRSLAQGCR